MQFPKLSIMIIACTVMFMGCGVYNEKHENVETIVTTNPRLLDVSGTQETGYRYTFKSGLVCNRPAYYTKYIKTGGAVSIKSLFEVKGDFESDWKKTSQANPKLEELQSVFFDVCFEHGNGLIDEATYKERSLKYDRIRQKILEQGLSVDPDRDIRFEARLVSAKFYQLRDKRKGEFVWKFEPTLNDPTKAINVFLGLTVLHDEAKVSRKDTSDKSCEEVLSCLSYKYWDMQTDPIIIRGGPPSNGSEASWVTEIPNDITVVRLYWEFYQREADLGNKCSIATRNPKGGIPSLEVTSPSGSKPDGVCYYSKDKKIIKVVL